MPQSLLIITGHSQGLGRAVLDHYLAQNDFQILAISRTKLEIESPRLTQLSVDLSELPVLEEQLGDIFPTGDFEKIILLNNAGWIGEIKPIGNLQPKKLRTQVNVNLLAPMYLTNAFIKFYKTHQAQKIVCNISSGAASRPVSGWGGYCSTKAALAMFTLVAAKENKSETFHFYSLAPGIVDTGMQGEIRDSNESDFPEIEKFKSFKEENKLTSPEEVALKIEKLFRSPDQFKEVIQDVRSFELN
ncbi:SDR family NAD(P)-dependent oxidoreductase [Algoriphagus pacificus]|uniref:SDR family NAD(P)-dependent oxidoreductase n=1 Tax=Algoriphagus pacificus TaxID=2811234 RepID=A0ABS3CDS6_9BACT|nr:SDR family NAD(P)-dependent oxidoreductase [Algoriphagus pacificus]MBN7815258.1 SDR family NAD(P)-dependent oxidoreductase [Algoriphagus pacificus]